MILLPHGCSCSNPSVNPKNWQSSKLSINKNWRITYYFRDPAFKDKYPYGKLISIKGMNGYKDIEERRIATQELIDNELYLLKEKGFNPITKEFNGPDSLIEEEFELDPKTPLCDAIEWAYNNKECAKSTKSDLRTVKTYFNQSARELRLDRTRISEIRKRHIRLILENQSRQNKYSNNRYNKVRAYVLMLFERICESEALENNPVEKIKLRKKTKKLVENFKDGELKLIKPHLRKNYYTFYRYVEMFFHAGCRSSELMRLKIKHINISNQTFKITVLKGKYHEEQLKAININVLHLWRELIEEAKKSAKNKKEDYLDYYLFSKNLTPGSQKIAERQISNRWRKHVKKKLNINTNFYTLKHHHTTLIIQDYEERLASQINGHKSAKMNAEHYDLMRSERLLKQAKNLNISL